MLYFYSKKNLNIYKVGVFKSVMIFMLFGLVVGTPAYFVGKYLGKWDVYDDYESETCYWANHPKATF